MKSMKPWKRISPVAIIPAIFLLGIISCDLIKMREDPAGGLTASNPVARVGEQYLYSSDLEGIASPGISPEDSTNRVARFIDNWVRKQLLIQEAATKIEFDEAAIERKILEYRFSLMGYEYQSFYVNKNLNKNITEEEIKDYYDKHIDNFVLKQNIIRGKFIKLPVSAPKIDQVKALITSDNKEKQEELRSYALSFAATFQFNDSAWMIYDELIKNSPLAEIPNKIMFLRRNKFIETHDDDFRYFLKIEEYRISDNISPLEFVKEDIKNIIINKRKVQLARQLEEHLYEKAAKNNAFEIY